MANQNKDAANLNKAGSQNDPRGKCLLVCGTLLIAGFGPVGNSSLGTLVLLAGLLGLATTMPGRRLLQDRLCTFLQTPLPWFLGMAVISAVATPVPLIVRSITAAYVVVLSALWVAVGELADERNLDRWLRFLLAGGAVAAVIGLASYLFFHQERALTGVMGFMGLAMMMVMLIPVGAGYLAKQGTRVWLPYVLLLAVTLALTFTRGAWIGLTVACLVMVGGSRRNLGLLALAFLVGAGIMWFVPPLHNQLVARLATFDNGRFGIWLTIISMIKSHPWLGVGLGGHPLLYSQYLLPGAMPGAGHAHNLFLGMAADLGIPGLMVFLVVIGFTLWRSLPLLSHGTLTDRGLVAGFIGVLAHEQFDIPTYGFELGVFFWLWLMLLLTRSQAVSDRKML